MKMTKRENIETAKYVLDLFLISLVITEAKNSHLRHPKNLLLD